MATFRLGNRTPPYSALPRRAAVSPNCSRRTAPRSATECCCYAMRTIGLDDLWIYPSDAAYCLVDAAGAPSHANNTAVIRLSSMWCATTNRVTAPMTPYTDGDDMSAVVNLIKETPRADRKLRRSTAKLILALLAVLPARCEVTVQSDRTVHITVTRTASIPVPCASCASPQALPAGPYAILVPVETADWLRGELRRPPTPPQSPCAPAARQPGRWPTYEPGGGPATSK
jgi:hypothetical protein